MKPLEIKNLIFDMGNVIIDIDPPRTMQAFADLAGVELSVVLDKIRETQLFHRHESGQIDEHELRNIFREELNGNWADAELDSCWNALLFPLPKERLHLLESLGQHFKVYLLSNTNAIHLREIDRQAQLLTGQPYETLFEQLFLSYKMGKMKPHLSIYEQTLADAGILGSESLFIDDVLDNVNAANQAGIHTIYHNPKQHTILDYFDGHTIRSEFVTWVNS
ncbi:MAG: HAD family phosphatase [Spirosomataceae bacterium]